MNRAEFEALRDLPGKIIDGDIRFVSRRASGPLLSADDIRIHNDFGIDLRLHVRYNPVVRSKTINVIQHMVGPICRLDVDGQNHPPFGRSHKHSLLTDRCPDRNLPDDIISMDHLAGQTFRRCFGEFCRLAKIEFRGILEDPESTTGGIP